MKTIMLQKMTAAFKKIILQLDTQSLLCERVWKIWELKRKVLGLLALLIWQERFSDQFLIVQYFALT